MQYFKNGKSNRIPLPLDTPNPQFDEDPAGKINKYRISGYYFTSKISLDNLSFIKNSFFEKSSMMSRLDNEILYLKIFLSQKSTPEPEKKDPLSGQIFVFNFGVIVLWGFTEIQEHDLVKKFLPYTDKPSRSFKNNSENLWYLFINENLDQSGLAYIVNDLICFDSRILDGSLSRDLLKPEHCAVISYALSQSIILNNCEDSVTKSIEYSRKFSSTLASKGEIGMSRSALAKQIGELFDLRIKINLAASILDEPDVVWRCPYLDATYHAVRDYLDIGKRVQIVEKKCSVISDMLEMMREESNSNHGQNLEWIVIILIFIEILIGIYEYKK